MINPSSRNTEWIFGQEAFALYKLDPFSRRWNHFFGTGAVYDYHIHPYDASKHFFSISNTIYKSIDGGQTWTIFRSTPNTAAGAAFFHGIESNRNGSLFITKRDGIFKIDNVIQ